MKILLTGANGFIGKHVINILENNNIEYIATDYHFDKCDEKHIECDLFSEQIDFYEFFHQPDIVLHLAWRDGFVHNSDKHMEDLSKHYIFLKKLIISGVNQVAVLGTMHEIGYYEGEVDENTPCNPLSKYGIAKNALRKSIELLCLENKVVYQWIRAFYIYSNDTTSNSIFSKIIKSNQENKTTFPFTTGKNKYDFITVEELSNQIVSVIQQSTIKGIINCCSGKPISLSEKVEEFIKENELQIQLEYGMYPERAYDSPLIYGNNIKIKKILEGD